MGNPTPPCWLGHQPFHPKTISEFLTSAVNVSDWALGLCRVGCLLLVTSHSMVWVDLVHATRVEETVEGD